MKVAIIGPGALGCYLAARLTKAHVETVLVDHRPDRIDRLNRQGITLDYAGETIHVRPKVVPSVPSGSKLTIICVKSNFSNALQIDGSSEVLTFQGGLGNVETLCSKVGSANILAGVISDAAVLRSEGNAYCTYPGSIRLGSWTSCPTATAEEVLGAAGFPIEITDAPGQVIWENVAVQSGIEPLTAILNVSNGKIIEIPAVRQLMRDLVVEAVKVASTEGYRFNRSLVEVAEERCIQTYDHISAMLQDVRQGKVTEIESVSGEILRRAQHAALPCPRTRVVWQMMKGLEQR